MKIFRLTLVAVLFVMGITVVTLVGCSGGGGGGGGGSGSPAPETGGLPPDPGAAGDATVAGIDINNNGVRDDVERAIHARNPGMPPPLMRALMQEAKGVQMAVMAGQSGNVNDMDAAVQALTAGISCAVNRLGEASSAENRFIEYTTVNTDARIDAYDKFNYALTGQFFRAPTGNTCE